MPIITEEKIQKPRILLLDVDTAVANFLKTQGYKVVEGSSGFSGKDIRIPVHPSELELIFWDYSKVKKIEGYQNHVSNYHLTSTLSSYFYTIRGKGGVITLLLGNKEVDNDIASKSIGYEFNFSTRRNLNIIPPKNDNLLTHFFNRFIQDGNLRFSINWKDNLVNYNSYYVDEDQNNYVGYYKGSLLILPLISKMNEAILMLLQDVYPHEVSEKIFPDLVCFNWENDRDLIFPSINKKRDKVNLLTNKYQQSISLIEKQIDNDIKTYEFLTLALKTDDSELFPDEKKLKTQVKKILEIIGFIVEDIDQKKKALGISLTEDLQVKDGNYLALTEVKGTDKGAKSNWVKKDLQAHLTIYLKINDLKPSQVNSILVFNHDRRIDPRKRSEPFQDDPDLVKACEKDMTTLIPIYELYKLCIDVILKKIDKVKAKNLIKKAGLFKYK